MQEEEGIDLIGKLITINVSAVFIDDALIDKVGLVVDLSSRKKYSVHTREEEPLYVISIPCEERSHRIVRLFRSEFDILKKLDT